MLTYSGLAHLHLSWLVCHRSWMDGWKVIELGSGTGAVAIFLHKSFQVGITTSDHDDAEIEENIAYNCQINGVTRVLPHVRYSWGDVFPIFEPKWNLIIAIDILLCFQIKLKETYQAFIKYGMLQMPIH